MQSCLNDVSGYRTLSRGNLDYHELVLMRLDETRVTFSRLIMKPNILTDLNDRYRVAKRADGDQAQGTSR
jgi:hypothetical protein